MKQRLVRYALGLVVLLVLLGHSAQLYQIPLISHLDAIAYDAKLRLTMPQRADDRVVILDIDEQSLAEVGRWPWGRDKLADLVDKLFDRYKIAVLGFDVVFAERDDSSGLKTLESLAGRELRDSTAFQASLRDLRPHLDHDARFARALRGRSVALGFYLSSLAGKSANGALPEPVLPEGTFQGRNIAFTHWNGHGGNLAEFQQAAAAGGHINPLVDFDGVSRRVPMIVEYKGAYYESLSLALVRLALGQPKVVPGFPANTDAKTYADMEWIELPTAKGTLGIPVDENAASLVPYRGYRGSYRYIPMADVLADRVSPAQLDGRIVIVGTTAPGLMDLRVTPVGNAYPGVEIHANLVAGMLDGSIKYKPAYVLGADVMLLMLAGGVMVFLLPLLSPLRATGVALAVLLFIVGVNLAFWQMGNLVLPLANAVVLVLLLYGLNMSWGYFVESRSKRQFAELFGQYVPPELVDEMARNPENYSMNGRRAELTVLFSDVRGFTTISEGMEPDQLAALMNEYLGAMTKVIREHRGTLDKYIGDAIMAFWGAPMADPQHARQAVMAAMGMQQALLELNQVLTAKGWPALKIGIGVNTGIMTVGDMGSPVRKAYTVMGDAVNLGSRLESITKQYGVGIIVGEATRETLRKEIVFRELDRVRVKGKDEPVAIHEPLGLEGRVEKSVHEELKLWNQALRAYRSQEWDQAELALTDLARMAPLHLYELYAQRIAHYRKEPPGADWDGVWKFETK
ncbi:adenylate/guanylate cyclase domain-containing protein [Denitratisoma sp. DHT3]|uniref:CHASE2 domain-containing protein n=1 Tax=Denitratisoma sp. DHT3 TaxID=1981880 RepID=UPI0011988D65|nr:adenylate/guanylate cyclase domain-containing protein [Denitratisoma sp. DHT3]QDX80053.1 adenylate/guanylate cyclase domain-containing protein [Denitratisoma sp. DHT3]